MNHKVLKRAIDLCWGILIVCVFCKAIGGDWFATTLSNSKIENNLFVIISISSITSYILFSFYYLAICRVKRLPIWVHVALLPYFICLTTLKALLIPSNFHLLVDCLSNFVLPFLLLALCNRTFKIDRRDRLRIAVAFCMNSGFQTISVLIRSISVSVTIVGFLPQLILTIDVLIMLILYWLYSLLYKKEVNNMSLVFTLLMGKGEEELKSMLADVNAKLEKDPDNSALIEEKSVIEKALSER